MKSLAAGVGGPKCVIGGPFGSKLTQKDYQVSGIPVIRGGNMEQQGRFTGGAFAYVSAEKFRKDLKSNSAAPGDIIVTQRGTLGQVSIIPEDDPNPNYVVSQSQMAIKVDPKVASRNFVYYFLKSPAFANYLSNATIQTGVPHINLGILRDAPVIWPDVSTQEKISAPLITLDDKIELNQRMNETLEGVARAVFKDWFVDFGPTRRKTAGETDPVAILGGLLADPSKAAPVAALFPDSFGADGLPENWNFANLGELSTIKSGKRPPVKVTQPDSNNSIPVWGGNGVSWYTNEILFDKPLIITGRVGTLGTVYRVVGEVWVSDNALCIFAKPNFSEIVFQSMKFFDFQSFNSGSTQPLITQSALKRQPCIRPSTEIAAAYEELSKTFLDLANSNEQENLTLAATRDLLLPKLMSGEIRMKDMEPEA